MGGEEGVALELRIACATRLAYIKTWMLETWARDGQRPDKPHVLRVGIATPTGPWNARQQRGQHATPFHPPAGEPCPSRAETPDIPLSREREAVPAFLLSPNTQKRDAEQQLRGYYAEAGGAQKHT